jgi:PAS domain S-box-containing protein
MYYREVRHPSSSEIKLIQHASSIAGVAIERERAQAELTSALEQVRKSERQLQQTVDAIPQNIVVLTADGGIDYSNRTVHEYTGLTTEELMAGDFRPRVFHPEDMERLKETRRLAFALGLPWENEVRVLGKDEHYRWFLIRYNPLVDEEGRVHRWCAAGTDTHLCCCMRWPVALRFQALKLHSRSSEDRYAVPCIYDRSDSARR